MSHDKYTPELAAEVCRLAAAGHTLTAIAARPALPDKATIYKWMRRRPEFAASYRQACACRRRVLRRHRSHPGAGPLSALVYSPAAADLICRLLLDGCSLSQVSRMPGMPPMPTLWLWLRRHPEFRRRYEAACWMRGEILADEVLEIADNCLEPGETGPAADARLAAARLQIGVRRRRLGTLAPIGWRRGSG